MLAPPVTIWGERGGGENDERVDISDHLMGMTANLIAFAYHTERFGSALLATWVFTNPTILDRIDSRPIG